MQCHTVLKIQWAIRGNTCDEAWSNQCLLWCMYIGNGMLLFTCTLCFNEVLEICSGRDCSRRCRAVLVYEMSPNKINKSNAVKKEVRKRLPLCSSSALFCRDVGILAEAKEDQRGSLADDKAVAKSLFLIALAVGSSDSSGEALHLLGSGLKENLSCRLHACKSKCFLCLESAFSALKVIYPYAPISRVNLFFS